MPDALHRYVKRLTLNSSIGLMGSRRRYPSVRQPAETFAVLLDWHTFIYLADASKHWEIRGKRSYIGQLDSSTHRHSLSS